MLKRFCIFFFTVNEADELGAETWEFVVLMGSTNPQIGSFRTLSVHAVEFFQTEIVSILIEMKGKSSIVSIPRQWEECIQVKGGRTSC